MDDLDKFNSNPNDNNGENNDDKKHQHPIGFNVNELLSEMMDQKDEKNLDNAKLNDRSINKKSLIYKYGTNLNEKALKKEVDPVVGRDDETLRLIEILNRRTKNNPVLLGDAGVGKTAVVEGLAQKIVKKEVPPKLQNKIIIQMDMASLISGTGIRGQYEEKINKLANEIKRSPNVILFIDEIHEMIESSGSNDNNMDAGNILKPALSRGDFQLIGATTTKEFRNIEKDPALSRRFQKINIKEPSRDKALEILLGIKKYYEAYHSVIYTKQAIIAALDLSIRFIHDRNLPDKAIDIIDEAGSRKNLELGLINIKNIDKTINQYNEEIKSANEINNVDESDFLKKQINLLKEQKENYQNIDNKEKKVTEKDIEKLISKITGIPVGKINPNEKSKLKNMADNLKIEVIGQDKAIDLISKSIKRNRIGFNNSKKPIGSFLFLGKTGIGKTELAKKITEELFGTEDSMIRFDMSEFMETNSVSKLIGAPPGYVGYSDSGQLTDKVKRNPYSLILLDEIEKAHPDVINLFLQILDDGLVTDSNGTKINFSETIIIMTSNAGSDNNSNFNIGFNKNEINKVNNLSNYFKPELLNRFDQIINFNSLDNSSLIKITQNMLDQTKKTMNQNNIQINFDESIAEYITNLDFDKSLGARPLRRLIQDYIEDPITDFLLDNPTRKTMSIYIDNNKLKIK
ncbi:AAA domain-containing protein [Lactobacillus sp. S2-2]|uniref:AAA family ATPase n=1 Tax=Lactobacillus sp. S2-2 TaxID=2692917 RepID=UPI001F46821D|nr:ATP-dependent Clp protease ATP-binding subunit [Lactobacillus sp. S2-2]MCF6514830.1 AAA domain-containing protein [Lactobacillus sp. S2-2]